MIEAKLHENAYRWSKYFKQRLYEIESRPPGSASVLAAVSGMRSERTHCPPKAPKNKYESGPEVSFPCPSSIHVVLRAIALEKSDIGIFVGVHGPKEMLLATSNIEAV